ncbi:hypothetical protein C5748_06560 [Phyllobacterium phragmitis]|uniref:Uncharacterized protein n=1 Tax=Phyllobacterium phragmitis TaxID=2670329 RepID=A0A2S9IUT7_9HYPH|nr:hypothetical protein C5748_06560 [Phyllobacterium phragmitis]
MFFHVRKPHTKRYNNINCISKHFAVIIRQKTRLKAQGNKMTLIVAEFAAAPLLLIFVCL